MLKFLAEELSLRLVADKIITIEKRKYYTYGIELILNDLIIFLMVAIIAAITDTILISAIFSFIYCVLRSFAGGYHSKTYLGCFSTAFVNYSLMLLLNSMLNEWKIPTGIVMMMLSIPIIFILSPVENVNNPLVWKEKKKYKKISSILIGIYSLFFIISVKFLPDEISFVTAWSMFATALLMLRAMIKKTKEEKSNEETIA